ncbi:MAG: hypothetical protein M3Q71_03305 [Chloroflexota bacterium]|nr:hypothetical protein [Chloroflexota bacterium]
METKPCHWYPSEVSDDDQAFVVPYLTRIAADTPRRRGDLREVFDTLRWIVPIEAPRPLLPNHIPPREAVSQQTQPRLARGCFEARRYDLRGLNCLPHQRPKRGDPGQRDRAEHPYRRISAGYPGKREPGGTRARTAASLAVASVPGQGNRILLLAPAIRALWRPSETSSRWLQARFGKDCARRSVPAGLIRTALGHPERAVVAQASSVVLDAIALVPGKPL